MAGKWTRRAVLKQGALAGGSIIPTTFTRRSLSLASDDESEPNNSLDSAQMIETGTTIHGAVGSTIYGEDWFGFHVREGTTITVTFQALQMPALLDVFLVDSSGQELDAAAKEGPYRNFLVEERFELRSTADRSGNYYLHIEKLTVADPGGVLYGSREPYQFIVNTSEDTTPNPTDPPSESALTVTKQGTKNGLGGYFISVDGNIYNDKNAEAVIEGTSALDWVGPERGVDTVRFSGEITQFLLKGEANVYLNDSHIVPTDLGSGTLQNGNPNSNLPNTLTVSKDGAKDGLAAFAVEVDGNLAPGDSSEAIFSESSALDWVGPERGVDTVRFSGSITQFLLKGSATVYLNGSRIDPATI